VRSRLRVLLAFSYRQWIATADKTMDESLCYRLLDQCAELGVPSVKFTWRGEPLLHPKLPQFVDYAKKVGILEVLITTDAVTLTEDKSRALIEAGLDVIVYSFDGGTKATYEKMRVGRFHENTFEQVYGNIRNFARIRRELGSTWPISKIQMILTRDTFDEQEAFSTLFEDCVDDISVKAYTERGGAFDDLDPSVRSRLGAYLDAKGLPRDTVHWRDMDGNIFVAQQRLPCEQPYQRMMVGYDGAVSMCCYDWGSEYPIGFTDERAFASRADLEAVADKARRGAKGFILLQNVQMPKRYPVAPLKVQTLAEIWDGVVVNEARRLHVTGQIESVPICTTCPFKETYLWERVPDTPLAPVEAASV
jgi:MoaA/NifB/PqqE/SkfB family radical SAM enzyme